MSNKQTAETIFPGLRGAAIFYALAFALSWAIWGTLILFPQTAEWAPLIIIFGAYGPLIAALILSRQSAESGGARRWFRSVSGIRGQWRWIILGALILPLLIAITHLVIYRLQVGPFALSSSPPWYWSASTAPLNILVLFWISSAIEEYGWQGFAMPRLAASMHPLLACLLHGIIWGTWHLPLYYTGAWKGDYQALWLLYGITITLALILIITTCGRLGFTQKQTLCLKSRQRDPTDPTRRLPPATCPSPPTTLRSPLITCPSTLIQTN